MAEYWDIYDVNRNKTGEFHERGKEIKSGKYHLVVGIWIKNKNNEILVTQRSKEKAWSGYWECTGGAVVAGEDSITGAKRELYEEIGVEASQKSLKFLGTIFYKSWFTDTYLLEKDIQLADLKLQKEEVSDAKWVNISEFDDMCAKGIIAPVILEQFKQYRNQILEG